MTVFDAIQTDWAQARQREFASPGVRFELIKRMLDLCGALLALLLFSPVLLFAASWVKFSDGGPVFYRQYRVGRDGKLFRIWKLRTMRTDAEADGPQYATDNDPRIVRGCGWMRTSHVDELPQLLNILRGEMSLVGPRPERPELMDQLRKDLPGVDRRLAATPGITGLAQVVNGYTNDLEGMRRKLDLDLRYLEQRSIRLDARLILKTFPRFWDRTAC
jgi:lipopolysaccharide/colanic/teichoic acid biosynthesis glycosyltransferase